MARGASTRRAGAARLGAWLLIAGALLIAAPGAMAARRQAILIGVSTYPYLKGRDLKGPRNDVRLMFDTLRRKGFDPRDITVLADGVPDALHPIDPTRANILAAIDRVIATLNPGDFLFIEFSGHGAQQPERVPGQEPDGLDEIFLARDVTRWDTSTRTVIGTITDDEIGTRLRQASARGARVWSVFDTCHAGTMTRGIRQETRRVPSIDLEIPVAASSAGASAAAAASRKAFIDVALPPGSVAFYATSPYSTTAEYRPQVLGDTYGFLSYVLAEGLNAYPGVSYRQLGEFIHQRYGALNVASAGSPYFEGELDVPVFGDDLVPRLRQWQVQADDGSLWIDAGALSLFAEGARFILLRDPRASAGEAIAQARAVDVTATSARLVPLGAEGKTASAALRQEWSGTYARLVDPNPPFQVRAAVRLENDASGKPVNVDPAVSDTLRQLRIPGGAGPRLVWLDGEEDVDLEILVAADRIYLRPAGSPLVTHGREATTFVPMPSRGAGAQVFDRFATDLKVRIMQVAKSVNLLRVANQYLLERSNSSLRIRAYLQRAGDPALASLPASEMPSLSQGDTLYVEAENGGRDPVDITILSIDPRNRIQALFPSKAYPANRLAPGSRRTLLGRGFEVFDDTVGVERLVILADRKLPDRDSGASDFTYLAADDIAAGSTATARGIGGSDMLDKAMGSAGPTTRGGGRRSDSLAVWVYSWRTVSRP